MNISLSPEILFNIGSFPVTNSFLWSVVLSVFLISITLIIKMSFKQVPGRLQGLFEVMLEGAYNFVRSVIGDDKKTKRIFPLVFTMFIFILFANLITFIPGYGAFSYSTANGEVPAFRSIMSDYSLVFVMTMITIIITQVVAIICNGPFGYIGKFINLSGIKKAFTEKGTFGQRLGKLAQGFLDFFLGLMDIVGEIAKIISLSFRLFGNIFAGEVLGSVMFFIGFSVIKLGFLKANFLIDGGNVLVAALINLPFVFLGLLTAVVQAFVFSVLTLIFISMASEVEEVEA